MSSILSIKALLKKDLACIWNRKSLVVSSFGFSLLLVVVSSFAFRRLAYGQEELMSLTPGILWIIFLFAGIIALTHSFLPEYENDALIGVVLSPVDSGNVFLAKYLSNLCFIFLLDLFILFMHTLFFGVDLLSVFPELILLIFLFCLGFVAIGTLLSAMAAVLKERELILPLILFPLLIPSVAGSIELSHVLFSEQYLSYENFWFALLCAFDIISLLLSWILFEYILTD